MEKEIRIRKRDRFRRIKNKNEPVYKTPAFLKNATGISCVTESGIFQTGETYSKVYTLHNVSSLEEITEISERLRSMNVDYGFLTRTERQEDTYLLLHIEKKDMQEAMEWFSDVEEDARLTSLTAEQRLKYYGSFLADFLGKECKTDSYFTETSAWKMQTRMEGMKPEGECIRTNAGAFQIMAVRRFPDIMKEQIFQKLAGQKAVVAAYVEAAVVTNQAVLDTIASEYLGLDGILPRMKRSNPLLYGVLNKSEEIREGSFISAMAYFLLGAADEEELERNRITFVHMAKENGILMERVPFPEMKRPREMKETIAMFAMSGNRSVRYKSILPAGNMAYMFPGESADRKQEEKKYDIEEMRALFFA